MSSFKRKMQRQIQKNNGTLLHKKVVARKMGCKSVEEYNRRMARREKNLKEMEDNKDGKGNVGDVTFIRPCFFTENSVEMDNWVDSCMKAEQLYKDFILIGRTPQEARSILPNSLKTEVVMTANLREWRHFLSLRACGSTGKPHPQMLEVAVPLLKELRERVPVVFDDLEPMELETVK